MSNKNIMLAITAFAVMAAFILAAMSPVCSSGDSGTWGTSEEKGMTVTYQDGDTVLTYRLDNDPGDKTALAVNIAGNSKAYGPFTAFGQNAGIDLGKALEKGTYLITVTGNGVSASCKLVYGTFYSITVENAGHGTATADHRTALQGERIQLSYTADPGYSFKEWQTSDVTIVGDSFTMPAKDVTVKAIFSSEPTYSITVTDDGHGSASVNKTDAVQGETVVLGYEADAGYVFDKWISDDVTITDNTFIMPGKNVTVKATFKETAKTVYVITVTVTGNVGGTITGEQNITEGGSAKFFILADEGYILSELSVDGKTTEKYGQYTFENVTANHSLTATFSEKTDARTYIKDGDVIQTYAEKSGNYDITRTTVTKSTSELNDSVKIDDNADAVYVSAVKTVNATGGTSASIDATLDNVGSKVSAAQLKKLADVSKDASDKLGITDVKPDITIDASTSSKKSDMSVEMTFDTSISGCKITAIGDKGTMKFSKDSLKSLKNEDKLEIVVSDASGISEEQKKAAQGNTVLDIYAKLNGTVIVFDKGAISMSIPYTLKDKESADNVALYNISDNASVQKIGGTYSDGILSVDMEHFSYYFVTGSYSESSGTDNTVIIIAVIIGAVIVVALVAVVYLKKKKKKTD